MSKSRLAVALVVVAVCLAGGLTGLLRLRAGLPAPEEIASFRAPASTRVYDCKDRLVHEFYQERRSPVPLETIPQYLKDAVIVVEDKRFYSHWGIDLARIPGVVWGFIRNPGQVRGTSTITQQLARSMFLSYRRSIDRKVKEAILAVEIERHYSKSEILEMYLNQIWFGGSVYGVQSAAWRYFGKHVSKLDLAECATLAAMLANPSAYSPYQHADRLVKRRDFFLAKLLQARKITNTEYNDAKARPLLVKAGTDTGSEAPYFVEEIRRDLVDRYGPDFVYRSGAAIYTTLDLDVQRAANNELERQLAELESGYRLRRSRVWYDSASAVDSGIGPPQYLQGAVVVMDVHSGYVRAIVGGRDFRASEFNRATQAKRQAGSSFKPFLYAAALDNGFTPADIVADSALAIDLPNQPRYEPRNYDGKLLGNVTLRRALALSRNLVSVRLIQRIGPELMVRYANLAGIEQKLPAYYSLALGAAEVTLIEMTTAFCTFAGAGVRVQPMLVERIEDSNGSIVEEHTPKTQPVVAPTTAYILTSMMQSVVDEGTATAIRAVGYSGPAAGKTGTTDEHADAWFVGYTPSLCCGVWVGYDKKKTIFSGATGGGICAPVWGRIMQQVPADTLYRSFPVPDSIVTAPICEQTGKLATANCPRVRYEVFVKNTEPTVYCPIHAPQKPGAGPDSFTRAQGR